MANAGSCLLCGASGGPIVFAEGSYVGRQCTCGTVYIDPLPMTGSIDPTIDSHLDVYYALPAGLRVDWVSRHIPSGRFLDVGCGFGSVVAEALQRGYEVHAVEPNQVCADFVARTFDVPVEQATIEETRLPRSYYDVVFHIDLLSHFRDPVRALRAMSERLRPGGMLCFEVGLVGGLPAKWYPWTGRPGFPQHLWFYSEDALRCLLQKAELRFVDIRSFSVAPATVLATLLRKLTVGRIRAASPPQASGAPSSGSWLQQRYARLAYILRYRLGGALDLPGPRTAFVAAAPSKDVVPLIRT